MLEPETTKGRITLMGAPELYCRDYNAILIEPELTMAS